jgi:iron complex outermembrane recepter protein
MPGKETRAPAGNGRIAPSGHDAMSYRTPAIITPWNWAGSYAGGNIGYGLGSASTESAFNGAALGNPLFGGEISSSFDHLIFGGQAGHNWQADRLLVGVEGDFQDATQHGAVTSVCPGMICNFASTGAPVSTSLDHKLEWFATLRGRLGMTVTPDILAYATAGVPIGDIRVGGSVASSDAAGNSVDTGFSTETIRIGWTVGAGIEGSLIGNWTAKIEYLHMDFGSFRNTPMPLANACRNRP